MIIFKDREALEAWLDGLDYEAFWREVASHEPAIQSRRSCDAQIAEALIDADTVLDALKLMVRIELTERYQLARRDERPWLSLH
ncbi:MAG: hypothetical protein KDJ43_10890 [Rhizobiaceae bacterium]|nr:hypothetical protein [Rhizobiaceae bacterium]